MVAVYTDPIADMLTRIRNANQVLKPDVSMPSSKLKVEVAKILAAEGYVDSYKEEAASACRSSRLHRDSSPIVKPAAATSAAKCSVRSGSRESGRQ